MNFSTGEEYDLWSYTTPGNDPAMTTGDVPVTAGGADITNVDIVGVEINKKGSGIDSPEVMFIFKPLPF